jgi:hypothetical protein
VATRSASRPDRGREPPYRGRPPHGEGRLPPRRSHAAVPLALGIFVAGLILGYYWFVLPALLGIGLLYVALSFLSSRLNPFSIGFYLTTKPSWIAIATLVLAGLILIAVALGDYSSGFGPGARAVSHLP